MLDRLIGFESLHLLVYVCLGIFKNHEQALLKCVNQAEVEDCFFFNSLSFLEMTNSLVFSKE